MGSCLKYMHLFPPLFYSIRLGPRRYILERCQFLLRRHKEQYVYFKMSDLTNEEKVYLIECFYSRGKNYTEAYRGFRTKFGSKRVASKNTLRRVIDNFINYYTLDDRRHDLPGPSYTVTTEDKVAEVEEHFKNNPTDSIRKAAVALKLNRETLRLIMKKFIKLHPYKITTHQLLAVDCKEKRIEFSKVMTNKLENNEININHIIFSDEAHFYLNGYVNKQNYRFWGTENPHLTEDKPKTKNDLREAIRKGISNISSSTIEQSFYSFQKRLDYCASSDGDHFENIYH